MEEPSFFDQIPERILLEIFKLLDLKSLAQAGSVSRRFHDIITANSKYLPKPTKGFKIFATKENTHFCHFQDDKDNQIVEFQCNDPEEFVVRCSSTEISIKQPFYFNWGINLQKHPHYSKRWIKEQAFRHTFSRKVGDGKEFDDSHPLPVTSYANSFEEALNFYLSHFDVGRLDLTEDDRDITADEMKMILQCVKANRTTISSIAKRTEVLDDVLIDLVKRTNCTDFTFCNYFDKARQITAEDENSIEKRITELSCENLHIYENGLLSIEKILELIQQWANGDRSIDRYNIHHTEMGLDWFPYVSSLQNIEVISEPEDIMWTMNADVYLKKFPIKRKIDGERLDFHYWDNYVEIKCYKVLEAVLVNRPKNTAAGDEDDEDFGLDLFD